jgi:hypothetical protein
VAECFRAVKDRAAISSWDGESDRDFLDIFGFLRKAMGSVSSLWGGLFLLMKSRGISGDRGGDGAVGGEEG